MGKSKQQNPAGIPQGDDGYTNPAGYGETTGTIRPANTYAPGTLMGRQAPSMAGGSPSPQSQRQQHDYRPRRKMGGYGNPYEGQNYQSQPRFQQQPVQMPQVNYTSPRVPPPPAPAVLPAPQVMVGGGGGGYNAGKRDPFAGWTKEQLEAQIKDERDNPDKYMQHTMDEPKSAQLGQDQYEEQQNMSTERNQPLT